MSYRNLVRMTFSGLCGAAGKDGARRDARRLQLLGGSQRTAGFLGDRERSPIPQTRQRRDVLSRRSTGRVTFRDREPRTYQHALRRGCNVSVRIGNSVLFVQRKLSRYAISSESRIVPVKEGQCMSRRPSCSFH